MTTESRDELNTLFIMWGTRLYRSIGWWSETTMTIIPAEFIEQAKQNYTTNTEEE